MIEASLIAPLAGMSLSYGQLSFQAPVRQAEDLTPGLKLAVLLGGEFELSIAPDQTRRASGPSVWMFLSEQPWRIDHEFSRGELRYVTLHLAADCLDDDLAFDLRRLNTSGAPVALVAGRAPPAMAAIAEQMISSPFLGAPRNLYFGAKGLELVAYAADHFLGAACPSVHLSSGDIHRLRQAREMLMAAPASAPSLPKLARACGLNTRKLTSGFRKLFGMSIAEFLREHRLQMAWKSLSCGACDVTRAAELAGYSLPHFTSAFQRRFGVSPSHVKARPAI